MMLRSRPGIVVDRRLAASPKFLRWLAFGLVASDERFVEITRWLETCVEEGRAADDGRWATLTVDQRDDRIEELHRKVVRDAVDAVPVEAAFAMGVSGGFDSRGLACLMADLGAQPVMYVHGQPGMHDYDLVGLVPAAARVHRIDVRGLPWGHATVVAAMRGRRNLQIAPRIVTAPVVDALIDRPGCERVDMTGFLNGALLTDHGGLGSRWAKAVEEFAAHNDLFRLQRLLPRGTAGRLLPSGAASARVAPRLQLEFGYRQFQRLRPLSAPGHSYVLPYEDPRWIGFWLTRPQHELVHKAGWVAYLARRFPEWFPDLGGLTPGADALRTSRAWVAARRTGEAAVARIDAPGRTMCWVSTYRDSPSFRDFVDDSVARLRGLRVLDSALIDDSMARLRRGDPLGRGRVRGLVATQVALENGVFEEGVA